LFGDKKDFEVRFKQDKGAEYEFEKSESGKY